MYEREPQIGDMFLHGNDLWIIISANVDRSNQLYAVKENRYHYGYTYNDLRYYINQYEVV